MSDQVTDRIADLRLAYRRMWLAAPVAAAAGLGLLPILIAAPQSTGLPALGVVAALAYTVRQLVLTLRMHHALRQLRMEEHFARINREAHQLQRCVRSEEHLWKRSALLRVVRAVLEIPPTQFFLIEDKKRAVQRLCRKTMRNLAPPRRYRGLFWLFAAAAAPLWLMSSAPLLLAFWTGLVLTISIAAEGVRISYQPHLQHRYDLFVRTIGEWTCTETLETAFDAARAKTYTHLSLYRDQPWLAQPAGISLAFQEDLPGASSGPMPAPEEIPLQAHHWSLATAPHMAPLSAD